MFVKSNMKKEVKYFKSAGAIVLKPGTVTYVDDNLVTAKELKDCYGDRINIMSREMVERVIQESIPAEVEEEENDSIEVVGKSTNKELDDFINGNTTVVPEGTKTEDEDEDENTPDGGENTPEGTKTEGEENTPVNEKDGVKTEVKAPTEPPTEKTKVVTNPTAPKAPKKSAATKKAAAKKSTKTKSK